MESDLLDMAGGIVFEFEKGFDFLAGRDCASIVAVEGREKHRLNVHTFVVGRFVAWALLYVC